jgi:chromosomal replication initiator protein
VPPAPDDPSHEPAWLRIRSQLRQAVTDATWSMWLEPLELASIRPGSLALRAPATSRDWVADRFGRLLKACAATELGPEVEVAVLTHDAGTLGQPTAAPVAAAPVAASRRTERTDRLNPRLTFDQFVIGDSNRLAHAAALAVAEMPALAYNPLFICGPPGLGKTHLLHSIANYVTAYGDGLSCRYTTVESFTNHFIGAIQGGGMDAFKEAYRGVDVLLVDDVQFLQSKVKTEEEFFHTFNELHASGAQIVLTSDRLPRDMDALEDRLRERFEAGLVCDVRPPDLPTRLTVLRKRVQQDAVEGVEPAALELIAERVRTNIRALEGALIRVIAFGSLTRRPVSAELAEEVLSGLYPDLRSRRRSIHEIQQLTADAFGVSLDDMLSSARTAHLAWSRQVAMYLSRELTDHTLPAIGRAFGNRNHTTVMHACRRTAERIAKDADAFATVERLTRELQGADGDRSA